MFVPSYVARRAALAQQLPQGSLAIIIAAKEHFRNGDAHYPFRQNSHFYYLTGFDEPDAILLVTAEGESIIFTRPRNAAEEQWTGERLGPERACSQLKVTAAYSISDWEERLPEWISHRHAIYYPRGESEQLERDLLRSWHKVKGQSRRGIALPEVFCDILPLLGEMRLIKDAQELNFMREAARISIAGHQRLAKACFSATYEYELEAEFLYEINRLGCRSVAYTPIVAAGSNACVLHYTANNAAMKAGDLVLVDAGGEFAGYAADITRVMPVNGRFSAEQRAIYDCVYQAQQAALALVKSGCPWHYLQQTIVNVITQGLMDLNILSGEIDGLIEREAYKPYYMHQSGHWLGLDVHDVGVYRTAGKWRLLQPNMCLTVEPGIYIAPHLDVDPRWHGIGIRIEDDVVVTEHGFELLSSGFSAEADEIEAFMRD
jgi:Xaa-Pro aminopeptidase